MSGHGRLREPASRQSAFRMGFNTPAEYSDMETFCGGRHFDKVTPRTCNICGGPPGTKTWMAPGRFATGTITKEYQSGGKMKIEYEATANHIGYFVVKLCTNVPSNKQDPPQSCFDQYVKNTFLNEITLVH